MATAKQVKYLGFLAITVGIAVMGLSSKIEVSASSSFAGILTFVVGLGLAGVGIVKLQHAAKHRG